MLPESLSGNARLKGLLGYDANKALKACGGPGESGVPLCSMRGEEGRCSLYAAWGGNGGWGGGVGGSILMQ